MHENLPSLPPHHYLKHQIIIGVDGMPEGIWVPAQLKSHLKAIAAATTVLVYRPLREKGMCEFDCAREYESGLEVPSICGIHGDYMPGERHFVGKSNYQVAKEREADRAARGDQEALKNIEDRNLGKPTQHTESVSLDMTLEQWTEHIGRETGLTPPTGPSPETIVVDVEPLDVTAPSVGDWL